MRFGGIFVAVALVLGACSGDPTPKEPDPTDTATSQPTSTAEPPEMPDQAKEDSNEGAAAFVDYWIKVLNYAAASGDVEELDRLSAAGCRGCSNYISLYRDTYDAGGYFMDSDWTFENVRVAANGDNRYVTVDIQFGGGIFKESAETDETRTEIGSDTLTFEVIDQQVTQLGQGDI